jgi:hypothetical protein
VSVHDTYLCLQFHLLEPLCLHHFRSAHDLATLTSSTRQSGAEPTSTQVTSLSELDNIDIFDFFNYPKLLEPRTGNGQAWQTQGVNGLTGESMRMPDPESDWLGYTPQYQ